MSGLRNFEVHGLWNNLSDLKTIRRFRDYTNNKNCFISKYVTSNSGVGRPIVKDCT